MSSSPAVWPCDKAAALAASGVATLQNDGKTIDGKAWPFDREAELLEAMSKSWSFWNSMGEAKKKECKERYANGTFELSPVIDHISALLLATPHWPLEARLLSVDLSIRNAAQILMERQMKRQIQSTLGNTLTDDEIGRLQNAGANTLTDAEISRLQKAGAIVTNADGTAILPDK